MDHSFDDYCEPLDIMDVETIVIHYKEATHNTKGELLSITYN